MDAKLKSAFDCIDEEIDKYGKQLHDAEAKIHALTDLKENLITLINAQEKNEAAWPGVQK